MGLDVVVECLQEHVRVLLGTDRYLVQGSIEQVDRQLTAAKFRGYELWTCQPPAGAKIWRPEELIAHLRGRSDA